MHAKSTHSMTTHSMARRSMSGSSKPRRSSVANIVAGVMVMLGGLGLGACGNGTSVSSPFATAQRPLEHGPAWQVKASRVAGLGTVLVDGRGLTLYVYADDQPGHPPTCFAICAVQWPPALLPPTVDRPVAGPGINADLLATVARKDGPLQITYAGWPLYYWPPDRSPGQATGQALTNAGGRWWVLSPSGHPITTPRA